MKILIATPIYPPEIGGPATYTKEICEKMSKNHNITVIAYTDSNQTFSGTKLIKISKNKLLLYRIIYYTFKVWKASRGVDIIYVQNAMAAGLPVALVNLIRGVPFVLKFVGDEAWERASSYKMTEKRLEEFLDKPEGSLRIKIMMLIQGFVLRRASLVTTPSIYLGQVIRKAYGLKSHNLIVNYNAAEEPEIIPFKGTRKLHQIVTTARLVPWKGIEGIIKAVVILKKSIPDIKLVVAGDGPELENLQKLARDLGVENEVTFLGRISRAETWKLRNDSEIYVLNSTYEGLPHTVLTSFAAEIPVVATDIMGTNEAVYNEKTGLLVKPGDDRGLAEAIGRLIHNPELKQKLVMNGKNLLLDKFSWEAHIKKLNEILESALSQPRN